MLLPVSNDNLTRWQLAVVIVWIIFTAAAFSYFVSEKLVSFDSENKLQDIDNQQLASSLKQYIDPALIGLGNSVLHFSKAHCDCQKYSEPHIEDINKIAAKNKFNIIRVVIDEHKIIPATPSVAIVDALGEIIYFGPYGQGLACSQTSGYAQTILNNLILGYKANIIIKEAQGCYCRV